MNERIFGKRGLEQKPAKAKPEDMPFAEPMYSRLHDEEIQRLLAERRQLLAHMESDSHHDDPDALNGIEKSIRARYEAIK